MTLGPTDILEVDSRMNQLFALVSEALAAATHALLSSDSATGLAVIVSDQSVDDLTAEVELLVWKQIDGQALSSTTLRQLVGVLLIVPELERSGDLAEHIAQRAVTNVGPKMSPLSRGIIQRMADVALEMWHDAADAYGDERGAGGCARGSRRGDRHPARTADQGDRRRFDADGRRRPGDAPRPFLRAPGGPRREPGPTHRDAAPPRLTGLLEPRWKVEMEADAVVRH